MLHIWMRDQQYLARGSYQCQRFGETLGADVRSAEARLRRLMTQIEDGAFVAPPSDPNGLCPVGRRPG